MGVLRHLDAKMAVSILSRSNFSWGIQTEFMYHWTKWMNESINVIHNNHLEVENTNSTLHLDTILNLNPYGKSVLKHYSEQSSLNENMRKLLCESIIHFCIDKEHAMSVKGSENLAKQIVQAFPGEEMVRNIF